MANSYLTRTPSGAGSRVKWTYSVWLKRSKLGHAPIWAASTDSNNYDEFYFNTSDQIQYSTVTSSTQKAIRTSRRGEKGYRRKSNLMKTYSKKYQ